MEFAFFPGCKIPYYQPQYGQAVQTVLGELGVGLTEIEFGCCGYPIRHQDKVAYLFTAARNLALAEQRGLELLTPCQCCFGSLRKAAHILEQDQAARREVDDLLAEEGLSYRGETRVWHLLQVLGEKVGVQAIKDKVVRPFKDLKLAVHYGCHALRPSEIVQFDDPLAPSIFERLVELTGAKCVPWHRRLQCCGNPLWGKNDALALKLTAAKLSDAAAAGADYLCVACTYCQIQFDTVQSKVMGEMPGVPRVPSVLYPQLLGLAMGLEPGRLGLSRNALGGEALVEFQAAAEGA